MKIVTVVVVVLALALGFFVYRSFRAPDPAYWIARGIYDRDVAAADAQHVKDVEEIGQWRKDDLAKAAEIDIGKEKIKVLMGYSAAVEGEIQTLGEQNKALRENAAAAIEANPALKALVANFDLQIIKYRDVNETLKATLDIQDHQINLWQGRYGDMESQCKTWEAAYNREHGLRLTSDSLRIKAEKTGNSNSVIAKVEGAVILGAAAFLGGKAVGHALNLW